MKHLNDDELKAYARNSFLHRTQGDDASAMKAVQEHLTACIQCQERYAPLAFRDSENLLKLYAQPAPLYPSITADVMWRVRNLQPSPSGWRFASIPVSLVLVIIFILAMALFALASHTSGNSLLPSSTTSQGAKTIAIPTLATQEGVPFISICHRPNEVQMKHMHICGYNYTPGSAVELIITMPETASVFHKTLTAAKDGTIHYALYIASCKSVPSIIEAVSENHRIELPSNQQPIQFGTCPPLSGVVGTPDGR